MSARRVWVAALAVSVGALSAAAAILVLASQRADAATSTTAPNAPAGSSALQGADYSGCDVCHGSPGIVNTSSTPRPSLLVSRDALKGSAHAALACTACHPSPSAVLHQDTAAELAATRASCQKCHPGEATEYKAGAHATASQPLAGAGPIPPRGADGKPSERPGCMTCHGTHQVQPVRSAAFIEDTQRKCAACHEESGKNFYQRDYHSKETMLGRTGIAVCADCHGAHEVLPESDPRSPVNVANRLQTCGKCHQSVSANFADIAIHIRGTPFPSDPKLRAATLYMMLILIVTFGLFGWHTAMGIRHNWRVRHARVPAEDHTNQEEQP